MRRFFVKNRLKGTVQIFKLSSFLLLYPNFHVYIAICNFKLVYLHGILNLIWNASVQLFGIMEFMAFLVISFWNSYESKFAIFVHVV